MPVGSLPRIKALHEFIRHYVSFETEFSNKILPRCNNFHSIQVLGTPNAGKTYVLPTALDKCQNVSEFYQLIFANEKTTKVRSKTQNNFCNFRYGMS